MRKRLEARLEYEMEGDIGKFSAAVDTARIETGKGWERAMENVTNTLAALLRHADEVTSDEVGETRRQSKLPWASIECASPCFHSHRL